MKYLFTLSTLFICITAFTQKTTKQQDIQNLLTALKIKATMQNILTNGIELIKKQKPAVPQQVWNDIAIKVDYGSYMDKVTAIFHSNYTQPEIKNLITQAKNNPKKLPLFKGIVQQQLYDAGKLFGGNYASFIKQTLITKGHH